MRLVRRGRGTDGRMCLDGVGASSSPENSSHGSEDPPNATDARQPPVNAEDDPLGPVNAVAAEEEADERPSAIACGA
jgi:hypothetical protein